MVKKRTRHESKDTQQPKPPAGSATAPPRPELEPISSALVELRPGLFVNEAHIVIVRVLPEEEAGAYAVMHLSSGDKLNLTREEFQAISGTEPRPPARLLRTYWEKNLKSTE